MSAKVIAWANEVKQLSNYATRQPHAAYSDFTHGLSSKWKFLMRTTNTDCSLFQPLEDAIRYHFLPAITGKGAFSDTERGLIALPVRLGGLGIENPTSLPSSQNNISMSITALLTNQILQQSDSLLPGTKAAQAEAMARVLREIRKTQVN